MPFGSFSLNEKQYNKHHFLIHDHFFAKSLDKVKSGGLVAFITSKGTLDKKNPDVRKYLAERAELVGTVRFPNDTFKANAGTEVTADLIILKKREQPIELTPETSPDWVNLGQTGDGLPINSYFAEHPEMVLGKIVEGNKLYGRQDGDTSCEPLPDQDTMKLLHQALDTKLKKLLDAPRKDNVVTFEELGIDQLVLDEAHEFKNCAKRCA